MCECSGGDGFRGLVAMAGQEGHSPAAAGQDLRLFSEGFDTKELQEAKASHIALA